MATLKATKRQEVGTNRVRHVRRAGMVPGIIYGHGKENLPVSLNTHDIALAIQHGDRLLELDIQGQTETVLITDAQYDPFGQDLLHVDLTRVDLDERVQVSVPIVLRGKPVVAEAVVQQQMADILVSCQVRNMPEEFVVSIRGMGLEDIVHARDIQMPEGVQMVADPDAIVVSLTLVAEEVAAVPAEGEAAAAQPEVIGAKPEEEGEAEPDAKGAKKEKDKEK